MQHYIIVKFFDDVDYIKFIKPITELFDNALKIDGISTIKIFSSNSKLNNRYDLMIIMELTQNALVEFDNSNIHKKWKSEYGKFIKDKVIFDCDN